MLNMTVENEPGQRVRVCLIGRLNTETYAQCEDRLRPVLEGDTHVLVFDLAQLEYLSSMGLRVLMKATKVLAARGGRCVLTRPQPAIRAVIDIANALPSETIFASDEEADHYLDVIQRRAKEEAEKKSRHGA
mgnify:CR=1 FL=1